MSKLMKLEDSIRIDVRDIVAAKLPDVSAHVGWDGIAGELPTETWLDELYDETITESVDRALIYTADIRQLWEELGEPEPDEMADTISDSIVWAVVVALQGGSDSFDGWGAAREGAYEAIVEWVSDNGVPDDEYSGDNPVEYLESIANALAEMED